MHCRLVPARVVYKPVFSSRTGEKTLHYSKIKRQWAECIESALTLFLYNVRLGIVPFLQTYCANNFHGLVFSASIYIYIYRGKNIHLPVQVCRIFLKKLVPGLDPSFKIKWPGIQNDGIFIVSLGKHRDEGFLHTHFSNVFLSLFGAAGLIDVQIEFAFCFFPSATTGGFFIQV